MLLTKGIVTSRTVPFRILFIVLTNIATKFVNPCSNVVYLSSLRGVKKVVRSLLNRSNT